MSSLFGSTTIEGNRLTEFAEQASAVGTPIPFGYGRHEREGKILFAPMPPKEHVRKKKQGKGGVKTTEYSYTLSYAIAFGEKIAGYWTITRNGKVVWTQDPNASVEDEAYAAKWAQKATFYYGTETQLPDSTIESYKGAGQVSAFRDLAYIVVEDDDVTDGAGAVPTYRAIVVADGIDYLTSPPYVVELSEGFGVDVEVANGDLDDLVEQASAIGEFAPTVAINSGELRVFRKDAFAPDEEIAVGASISSGELRVFRKDAYSPDEEIAVSVSINSGELEVARLDAEPPEEEFSVFVSIVGGSLNVP